jgi:hypothetical protein
MRRNLPGRCLVFVVPFLALLSSCRQPSVEQRVERLPDLPQELAATLDSTALSTKTVVQFSEPQKLPETTPAAAAPCCSSNETRSLKVNFPYTKCGPFPDLISVDLRDLVLYQGDSGGGGGDAPKMYKLREIQGRALPRLHICVSGNGPWDAMLTENRACSPYTPVYTLAISAFGDAVVFNWSGSQTPPSNVQIVSCNTLGVVRTPCGISNCQCVSSSCQPPSNCDCGTQWP